MVEEIIMAISMVFFTADSLLGSVVLRNGTNQMPPEYRASLTPDMIRTHEEGAKALSAVWFCYVAFVWGAKTCLLVFYHRMLQRMEQVRIVKIAGWILGVTFVATIIGISLVCRPFRKNWQVVPDPGGTWASPQETPGQYCIKDSIDYCEKYRTMQKPLRIRLDHRNFQFRNRCDARCDPIATRRQTPGWRNKEVFALLAVWFRVLGHDSSRSSYTLHDWTRLCKPRLLVHDWWVYVLMRHDVRLTIWARNVNSSTQWLGCTSNSTLTV